MKHRLVPILALITLISLAGCSATLEQRIHRADLAVGVAADTVRIGIETGHIRGDAAKAAKFGVNSANAAMVRVHVAYASGQPMDAQFILNEVMALLAEAAKHYGEGK